MTIAQVSLHCILKEIKGLSANKAVQDTNISVKVLKKNTNIFAEQATLQFDEIHQNTLILSNSPI